ncbi:MAG: hypothetical protein WC509_04510 [Candidatus Izemoplasmatales bacterium]
MGYFYQNLSDFEFESLARDILERLTGEQIRRFALGRDGGKDLADAKTQNTIIGQAKRYVYTDYRALYKQAKIESKRLNDIKPQQYFFFTTRQLTPKRVEDIFSLFSKYMPSKENVFDSLRIDDFLSKDENKDILRKNPKLIMCDMTAIEMVFQKIIHLSINKNIQIDVDDLRRKIKSVQKYFVDTTIYRRMYTSLKKDKVILVMGDPGTGKTVSSYMTILSLMREKYLPICSSSNNLDDIKKAVGSDELKEVILMDDFLGRVDSTISASEYSKQLETLINMIKSKKNKYLILNSRNYIWDYCKNNSSIFMEKIGSANITVISTNQLSKIERARILYNHIFHSGLPKEYKDSIYEKQFYLEIIKSPRYNPRVIEHFLLSKHLLGVPAEKYQNYITNTMNNPNLLWESEYKERLSQSDRVLLQTLYSISDTIVFTDKLRAAFEKRITGIPTIDKTIDPYKKSLDSLTNSFLIKISSSNLSHPYISFANPSIIDFIKGVITPYEKEQILESGMYIEQYFTLIENFADSDRLYGLIQNNKISSIISERLEIPELIALQYITKHPDQFSDYISDFVVDTLRKDRPLIGFSRRFNYQDIIVAAMEHSMASKLGYVERVTEIDVLNKVISNLDYNHALEIYNELTREYAKELSSSSYPIFKEKYLDNHIDEVIDFLEKQLETSASDYFDGTDYDDGQLIESLKIEAADRMKELSEIDPIINGSISVNEDEIIKYLDQKESRIESMVTAAHDTYFSDKTDEEIDVFNDTPRSSDDVDDSTIIDMFTK